MFGGFKTLFSNNADVFAISHFCKPHPGASWNFDHPSEKTVLDRTTLRELFCGNTGGANNDDDDKSSHSRCQGERAGRWEIVFDEIATDSDHGRTMQQFVARKL